MPSDGVSSNVSTGNVEGLRLRSKTHIKSTVEQFSPESDHRGRPLNEVQHEGYRASLLSHHTQNLNLRGFFNLFFIVLFVVNFSTVWRNIAKYGLYFTLPTGPADLLNEWPLLACFCLMHLCIVFAFAIERFVGSWMPHAYDLSMAALMIVNFSLVLLMPYYTIRLYKPEPTAAVILLCFSIIWFFKFLSFHHVCLDTRRALLNRDDMLTLCNGNHEEAKAAVNYPHCLTLSHFYRFIVAPTVCFQFHYPRTPNIRWFSILRHAAESMICIAMIKLVVDQYIVLVARDSMSITQLQSIPLSVLASHVFRQVIRLSIPNLYVWLLMFLGVFHHWCNILAELTQFGDRLFYLDWWNASSFGEYWRKWNIPIHQFLHRHVHKPLLRKRIPKHLAAFIVFFISALLHEYLIAVPLNLGWTGWVFLAFMAQVPLMYITNLPLFSRNPTIGNSLFWFIFCFSGQPMGILLYWYLWAVSHGQVQKLDASRIAIA